MWLLLVGCGFVMGWVGANGVVDLLSMIHLNETPACISWIHARGAAVPLLAVSFESSNDIRIYDARGSTEEPIHVIKKLHRSPVTAMVYNNTFDCVVSADRGGSVEYWSPNSNYEKPSNVFDMKSSTNLFEFKKVLLLLIWRYMALTDISKV